MNKDVKNGTVRPREGSVNRKVWDISDGLYEEGSPKLRKAVLDKCKEEGIKPSTASVEHCMWRRYTGLVKQQIEGDEQSE